jgi:hypothetical protein
MTDTQATRLTGGCLCGALRYRIAGAPAWCAHCHCPSCRRATGAAFATFLGIGRGAFTVTAGQMTVYDSSPGVHRGFCGRCGSALTYESDRWPEEIHILAATLDDPAAVTPEAHVFTRSQLPWIKLADGLARHVDFTDED